MEPSNNKGQILIEVSVVIFVIGLSLLVALTQFKDGKKVYENYELNKPKKSTFPFKK